MSISTLNVMALNTQWKVKDGHTGQKCKTQLRAIYKKPTSFIFLISKSSTSFYFYYFFMFMFSVVPVIFPFSPLPSPSHTSIVNPDPIVCVHGSFTYGFDWCLPLLSDSPSSFLPCYQCQSIPGFYASVSILFNSYFVH